MIDLAGHYRSKTARSLYGPDWARRYQAEADAVWGMWIDYLISAGLISGNTENTMYKFPMGAAVVLTTSFRDAQAEASEHDQQLHDEAARAARSVYSAAGRRDLVDDEKVTDSGWMATAKIGSYRQPVEAGTVVGRSEYAKAPPSYLVRYRAGDGRQVDAWLEGDALEFDPRVKSQPTDAAAVNGDNDLRGSDRNG